MTQLPTNDDAVNRRLAALGDYRCRGTKHPELRWSQPTGAPPPLASFELIFYFAVETPGPSAYAQLLDELDRLKQNADSLLRDARQCAAELFREVYAGQMTAGELAPYRGDDGALSDELILAGFEPGAIALTAFDEGVSVAFSFHSRWDDEHGIELELNVDYFARPWRDDDAYG